MNLAQFIHSHREAWSHLEDLLEENRSTKHLSGKRLRELTKLYRIVAADYAYAQTYFRGNQIESYLNKLVAESHATIYQRKKTEFGKLPRWLFGDVPRLFRAHIGYFWFSMAIFLAFGTLGFMGSEFVPDGEKIFLHFSITNPKGAFTANARYISMTEENIRNGRPFRVYEDDYKAVMSSSIMFNNIRVAVFAFAGGIFAGLVTFYLLAMTGMMVGAFFHIFYRHDLIFEFWNTVMLHGMIELTMIVMASMAGFMVAKGLLFPGKLTFTDNLKKSGLAAVQMAVIIGLWLVIAGTIEGTLTGAMLTTPAKLVINFGSLSLLILYFGFLGRGRKYVEPEAHLKPEMIHSAVIPRERASASGQK